MRQDHAEKNAVREVERPAINREEGTTLAFSKGQARKLLETPADALKGYGTGLSSPWDWRSGVAVRAMVIRDPERSCPLHENRAAFRLCFF